MSGVDKASILAGVASSPVTKRQVLRELGVPKSTYYRWLQRPRLDDRPGGNPTPWNRLTPKEQRAVLVGKGKRRGLGVAGSSWDYGASRWIARMLLGLMRLL